MKWVLPKTYESPVYPFEIPKEMKPEHTATRYSVAIIGAGPVGLTAALDLAKKGISSVVFSKEGSVSVGSRALCFSKKSLEVINRISPRAAKKLVNKGVTWNVGKVFYRDKEVYNFNLLPEKGHKMPAFINLQQYYFEEYLIDEISKSPLIDMRWQSYAHFVGQDDEKVTLEIESEAGKYFIESDYVLACDGVHSPTRKAMNLSFEGELFEENFLIADIIMENDFPTERWFWFDPPFNKGNSALLHKAPDGVWRIDLQLGWDIDRDKELEPERIKQRLHKMLGDDCKFQLEWTSIYNFRCMRMKKFIHNRVIFAGDSAHQVSPFGARGANSGIQDVDNLIWKLASVIEGKSSRDFLKTYDEERSSAADENIYHSTNATDFISPKSRISNIFRNATLDLAKEHPFAQNLVNSGRLSNAHKYLKSSLTTSDTDSWNSSLQPGCPLSDAPLKKNGKSTFLIDEVGDNLTLIVYGSQNSVSLSMDDDTSLKIIYINPSGSENTFEDTNHCFKNRYGVEAFSWYLIRPDHYIAARGKNIKTDNFNSCLERVLMKTPNGKMHFIKDLNPLYVEDQMYKTLIKGHSGLSEKESLEMNARLILLLMDKIVSKEEWNILVEKAKQFENS